jgi:dihydrolipoamide dehydrogenase
LHFLNFFPSKKRFWPLGDGYLLKESDKGESKGEVMKEYDVVVIGSGAGASVAQAALQDGLKIALIDKGPLGGTCLNLGCIPSKMMIFPADRVAEIEEAKKLGIEAQVKNVDFSLIMERMRGYVQDSQGYMRRGLKQAQGLDLFEKEGGFVDDYTLDVGGEKIKGEKIFISSGARVLIPPIKGLDKVECLTNESVLQLIEKPRSMVIIGGGYIATEFGHFFAAMGTDVTMLQKGDLLVPNEEPEVSRLLKKMMGKRMNIETNTEVVEVKKESGFYKVIGRGESGVLKEFAGEKILVAVGRRSNADLLKVENTGVETDKRGFVKANEYLETSIKNIWAFGDAIGKQMFRHSANVEADIAWRNSTGHDKIKMNYHATPHAVFTHPQIASVGLREADVKKGQKILVGRSRYKDVAKGAAMMEEETFAKAIVDKETYTILGFHIIGPFAPILIQEVVNAMTNGLDIFSIGRAMHIHPAMSEIVVNTLGSLGEV